MSVIKPGSIHIEDTPTLESVLKIYQQKIDPSLSLHKLIDEKIRDIARVNRLLSIPEQAACSLTRRILDLEKEEPIFSQKLESLLSRSIGLNLPPKYNPMEEIVRLNPHLSSTQQWYLKCIVENPKNLEPYTKLVATLPQHASLNLPGGRRLSIKILLEEALKWNSEDSFLLCCLAERIGVDEYACLVPGAQIGKQELFMKAIQLNPRYSRAYLGLGLCIDQVDSDQRLKKRTLLLKAIEFDENCGTAYCQLALLLEPKETQKLSNGFDYTKKELLLEALRCNRTDLDAYFHLAFVIHPHETVRLPDRRLMNQSLLLLQVLKLDPRNVYMRKKSVFLYHAQNLLSDSKDKEVSSRQIHAGFIAELERSVDREESRCKRQKDQGDITYDDYITILHSHTQQLLKLSVEGDSILNTEEKE